MSLYGVSHSIFLQPDILSISLFFPDVMYAFLTDRLSTGTIKHLEQNNKWPRRGCSTDRHFKAGGSDETVLINGDIPLDAIDLIDQAHSN